MQTEEQKLLLYGTTNFSGGALHILSEINEALCSSCDMKPEKFQRMTREHDGFRV